MNSRSTQITFHCLNDCNQGGCPGHTVAASYSHTSDTLAFEFVSLGSGAVEAEGYDENRFKAMMEAYNGIKW